MIMVSQVAVEVRCPTCRSNRIGIIGVRTNSDGQISEIESTGTETRQGEADPRGLLVEIEMICYQENSHFRHVFYGSTPVMTRTEESDWPMTWENTRWKRAKEANAAVG